MRIIRKLLFALLLLSGHSVRATHIVGGELYYHDLGNNNYEITLVVYRDCQTGVPPFDNPASIGIFDDTNILYTELLLNVQPDSVYIPITINNPCYAAPGNVCYVRAVYRDIIFLPPNSGGYQLAYQRCCRNQSIQNIINPNQTGATFYAKIPPATQYPHDSNPQFNITDITKLPPAFICKDLPFVFDHSATDADGDSISYELCVPLNGADQLNPMPQPPLNPPYANVNWTPGYGLGNMIGGVPPMSIDPVTGILTAYPNTTGQFVIGVCANEWRNGVLIGKSRRDYQLNVLPCPSIVVAAIQNPIIQCGSNTVTFLNNSFGASTYDWNFGNLATLGDTSHAFSPNYTYPDTGTYAITMIAHSTFNSDCVDTAKGTVHINPAFNADFNFLQTPCSLNIAFFDSVTTTGDSTVQWLWNFGDNQTSILHNPFHTYPSLGTYIVKLIVTSAKGCKDTIIKNVTVVSNISASITSFQNITCKGFCNGQATVNVSNVTPPYTVQWNDSLHQDSVTAINLCPGTYTVTIVDSNGCTITTNITITEPPLLTKTIASTDAYCEGKCIGTADIHVNGGTPAYNYIWSDPNAQTTEQATNLCPGVYTVSVTDNNGCSLIDSIVVLYSTYVPSLNPTTDLDTVYLGQPTTLHTNASGNFTYSWVPAIWLSNPSVADPIATPQQDTLYIVTITDEYGCSNTDSVRIYTRNVICVEPEIFIPNAFSPNNDSRNDVLYVRGSMIKELLLRIYDRWGEKVFESNSPNTGWDGTYKGKLVTPGVFVYYLDATCYNNEKFFKKGNITVIR